MTYYYAFIEGSKLIFRYFFNFFKKLFVIVFIYGLSSCIPILAALAVCWVLSVIPGIDTKTTSLVFKIIVTAGQIIPLSIYLYVAENELTKTKEDAPELCFSFCAAYITYVWTCL
jgi:hypothetical protein